METAQQPARELATNHTPPPITDRQKEVYHKRKVLDWGILGVVVAIALIVIALSFSNTRLLASELGLNEYLTAGLVEILFASLLFIRGRQRATQRNVPFFLSVGYFCSLGFVTGINMWGLSLENPTIGPIVGGAISAAMWLMESTLVWLWTDSHRPHKKSAKELEREAKREIEEMKIMQKIDWMKWNAEKPSLDLIKQARQEEQKREKIVAGGMPEFFKDKHSNTVYNQTNEQDQPEQTKQTTNKQDNIKQTKQTAEHTPDKQTNQTNKTPNKQDNTEQTPNIKHRTDKQIQTGEPNTQGEQTPNKQGTKQTDEQKVVYINNKQTAERTVKQAQPKRSKQTTNLPTYEQLLEMIDQTFAANKKLPTVRGFAEQANIKPNRAYTALKMWKEANGQTVAKKQTANN